MKNSSEIEKLEKELEELDKEQEEQEKKFGEKRLALCDKIESLKEEEARKKTGEKFYNKVVNVTETIPCSGIRRHYIGVINPDTVCPNGFFMYKNALQVQMEYDAVSWIHLDEYGNCSVGIKSYELFENGTVTYGDDSPRNEKHIFTIKLASKDDADFIRQAFEMKKKQDNAAIDTLRDFCISMIENFNKEYGKK